MNLKTLVQRSGYHQDGVDFLEAASVHTEPTDSEVVEGALRRAAGSCHDTAWSAHFSNSAPCWLGMHFPTRVSQAESAAAAGPQFKHMCATWRGSERGS
jgi:hypothetical protein